MPRVRWSSVIAAAVSAATLMALLTVSALGARPTKETVDLDDPQSEADWSAFMTEACGFPVAVDFEGSVTYHTFVDRHGEWSHAIDKWWVRDRFTNVESGASILLKDVGPDIWRVNAAGQLTIAITGRSLTGSGVIGRVLINLDTGETVSSGKEVGSIVDQVCPAID